MSMKKLLLSTALVLSASFAMSACTPSDTKTETTQSAQTPSGVPILGSFGVALTDMDTRVAPGDNFFKYVNGGWLERTEIPSDKANYGAFNILADQSQERVRAIVESAAQNQAPKGSAEQRIGDLYAAFMDEAAINAAGMTPIKNDIAAIRNLDSRDAITAAIGNPAMGLSSPFGVYVYIDRKNPTEYITYMTQSGTGLPDRDDYFGEDERSKNLRAAYIEYVTTALQMGGIDDAASRAQNILAFETKIAETHWSRTKRRNRDLTYNKMSLDDFKAYAPGVNWDVMIESAGLSQIDELVLSQDDAIAKSAAVFANADIGVLQDYLTFHYINDMAPYLPTALGDARFAFYGTAVRGTEVQQDRWKRGVSAVSGVLGEAIGEVYVKAHFPESSKAQMLELVENLRATFKVGIDNLEWMGADTKVKAQDKLAKFNPKIGYPDVWERYEGLTVDRNDLVGTMKSAAIWEWEDNISQLGQPINRDEWGMTPQRVNAYYNSSLNEIVFPAAILDAPFFDPNADPAVNYGGIGAVIGHEMGHGFDDQGRKTDGDGLQTDWWTPEDAAAFEARANALVEQYNQFEPLPGVFINGKLSLGENIGDLTGITMAYAAYKRSLNGVEPPVIDGFTGDQRFFLAYGQIWKRKFRDKAMETQVKNGPHSPGEFRANGIVRNFDPWYEAFDVGPEHALYLPPEQRVKIW